MRGKPQTAKNSPFPCGLDSKPAESVGTPLGPSACGLLTSERTEADANLKIALCMSDIDWHDVKRELTTHGLSQKL